MCRTDVVACAHLSLLYPSPFSEVTLFRFVIFCQLLILGFFTVLVFSLSSIAKIREAIKVSKFFREGLKIADDRELIFLDWHSDILRRITEYQASAVDAPLCIVQPELDSAEITNLILRLDNFVVAILKKFEKSSQIDSNYFDHVILSSSTIRFLLQFGLVSWFFDDQYRIRSELMDVPVFSLREQISNRFKFMALVYLVFMFPIFIFGTFMLIIRESGKMRSGFSSLSDYEITGLATIVLRHFSEMDHEFRKRMEIAIREFSSVAGTKIWNNEIVQNFLKMGLFITSGILSVLALIALLEDKALVYLPVTVGGKNLFVYFALFSVAFGILVRADSSKDTKTLSVTDRIRSMIKSIDSTHFVPAISVMNLGSPLERAIALDSISTSNFFQKKILLFLHELLAIVMVPYVFYFRADEELVGATVSVLRSSVHRSANLGDFVKQGFFMEDEGVEIEMTESVSETKVVDTIDPMIALSVLSSNKTVACKFEHESLLRQTIEFKNRCIQQLENSTDYENFSLCFWYFLLRTVREGNLNRTLFGLDDRIVSAVANEPLASRASSRKNFDLAFSNEFEGS